MENNTIPIKTCPSCEGTGVLYTASGVERRCDHCGGDGVVYVTPMNREYREKLSSVTTYAAAVQTLLTHTPSGRIAHGRIKDGRQQ